jgi:hypothetical protein
VSRGVTVALALCATACVDGLQPGQVGQPRYLGQLRGSPPLALLPPRSDRAGNVYVLYGAPELLQVEVTVGQAGGGWSGGCRQIKGDSYGVHGWVGRSFDRMWYWAGDGLVAVSGRYGDCHLVLDRDRVSGADLAFRAVMPLVFDEPSRTELLAWVQSPVDPTPFAIVVDLNAHAYHDAQPFDPANATDVTVLGVGADHDAGEGIVLTRYVADGYITAEARYVDRSGATVARVPVPGAEALPAYAVQGYLETSGAVTAGVVNDGTTAALLVLSRGGASLQVPSDLRPVGVQRWGGALWLVGTDDAGPLVAPIGPNGGVGAAVAWRASELARAALDRSFSVLDDRWTPTRTLSWSAPVSALGPAPFVHPHSLDGYAVNSTGWLIAGPAYDVGGEQRTAVAFVPVGVTYP